MEPPNWRSTRQRENMDFETYARSKFADYGVLAETVGAILRAAIVAYPETFRLQQVQQRPKDPESLRKKLEDRDILATTALEDQIKDLAGCRLIFYTNSDVARFLQSGIIQDNFDVDWDRTKIHHPVPGQTEPDTLHIEQLRGEVEGRSRGPARIRALRRPVVRGAGPDDAEWRCPGGPDRGDLPARDRIFHGTT